MTLNGWAIDSLNVDIVSEAIYAVMIPSNFAQLAELNVKQNHMFMFFCQTTSANNSIIPPGNKHVPSISISVYHEGIRGQRKKRVSWELQISKEFIDRITRIYIEYAIKKNCMVLFKQQLYIIEPWAEN